MRMAYRVLLRLYPYDYRLWFADAMRASFDTDSPFRELCGLALSCIAEWIAKWTTDAAVRGRALPDWRMMRPVGVALRDWFEATPCSSDTLR